MARWLHRLTRGYGYLTLNPSPRLRRLRKRLEAETERRRAEGYWPGGYSPAELMSARHDPPGPAGRLAGWEPLPPLPDSCYPPGAVPLDCSGIPGEDERP